MTQRRLKFWGWGHEDDLLSADDQEWLAKGWARRFGVSGVEHLGRGVAQAQAQQARPRQDDSIDGTGLNQPQSCLDIAADRRDVEPQAERVQLRLASR